MSQDELNNLNWNAISLMSNAIDIMELNIDKLNPDLLNENKNAVKLLEKHKHLIRMDCLSQNTNAHHLTLCLDYDMMKEKNSDFAKELVTFVCHPNWIEKMANKFNIYFDEYLELLS